MTPTAREAAMRAIKPWLERAQEMRAQALQRGNYTTVRRRFIDGYSEGLRHALSSIEREIDEARKDGAREAVARMLEWKGQIRARTASGETRGDGVGA